MAGSLAHSPSDVIRYLLISLGYGTLPSASSSWPVHAGNEPDTPDNCITTYDTANELHGRTMIDGEIQEHEGVQIRIRGTDYSTGYAKANAIKRGLDATAQQDTVTIGSNTYAIHSVTRRSGVLSLGKDASTRRNLFTINVIAAMRQSS